MASARDETLRALTSGESLHLRNEPAELDRLMRWVVALFEGVGMGESTWSAVQICLDEAFANILEHGAPGTRATRVDVDLRIDGALLFVTIADNGAAFDPGSVGQPVQATSLDDAKIGGLGIHFIRTLSSSMAYERQGDRNQLTLTFPVAVNPGDLPSDPEKSAA